MAASRTRCRHRVHPSAGFEQELEDLDVASRLRQIVAPSVQPMTAQQKAVDRRRLLQHGFHPAGERRNVLVVVEDGNPLGVLVRAHAFETFEHLESAQTAGRPSAPWSSDSTVLQTEWVWSTAPAFRVRATATCSAVSADGRPPLLPKGAPSAPITSTSVGRIAPLETELAVMTSLSGFRDTTALKLPLVPSTHPRVWKSRPISWKLRATVSRVGFIERLPMVSQP